MVRSGGVAWREFSAGLPGLPAFAEHAAGRAAGTVDVDGLPQAAAWDLEGHRYRVCTDAPHGVDACVIEPDGGHGWWCVDGRWWRRPYDGGPVGEALPGVRGGGLYGLAFDRDGRAAVAVGVDDRTHIYVGVPGRSATESFVADGYLGLVDLDDGLLVVAGEPEGPAAAGVCPLDDGRMEWLAGARGRACWPLELRQGTRELLLVVERDGGYVLATWRPGRGLCEHPPAFDTEIAARWHGPGRGVLVQQDRHGRSALIHLDLDRGVRRPVSGPDGTILDFAVSPDGMLYRWWTRGDVPPTVLTADPSPPRSLVGRTERWTGPVHTFLATPPGTGPWPTVFLVHGGPATHDRDCYDPRVEVFTAAGYAVARTNYRGSTGYGTRWRHDVGTPGLTQVDDLAAVRADLVAEGIADPNRVALSGYSWGGYLALLAVGVRPRDWAAAMAAFPIADYVAAHHATTPALREVDIMLFGGTPEELPLRYRAASPMSYVDQVCAPVSLVASRTDERCPAGQVERYAAALAARGRRCDLTWVGGGHHSRDSSDHATVMTTMLGFLTEVVPAGAQTPAAGCGPETTSSEGGDHEATQRAQRPHQQRGA
jgi:acylaminoacyl-peptidase